MDEIYNACLMNVGFNASGEIRKIGYKSLKGFIQMIKRQNKRFKKLGFRGDITINLPIREK